MACRTVERLVSKAASKTGRSQREAKDDYSSIFVLPIASDYPYKKTFDDVSTHTTILIRPFDLVSRFPNRPPIMDKDETSVTTQLPFAPDQKNDRQARKFN